MNQHLPTGNLEIMRIFSWVHEFLYKFKISWHEISWYFVKGAFGRSALPIIVFICLNKGALHLAEVIKQALTKGASRLTKCASHPDKELAYGERNVRPLAEVSEKSFATRQRACLWQAKLSPDGQRALINNIGASCLNKGASYPDKELAYGERNVRPEIETRLLCAQKTSSPTATVSTSIPQPYIHILLSSFVLYSGVFGAVVTAYPA